MCECNVRAILCFLLLFTELKTRIFLVLFQSTSTKFVTFRMRNFLSIIILLLIYIIYFECVLYCLFSISFALCITILLFEVNYGASMLNLYTTFGLQEIF